VQGLTRRRLLETAGAAGAGLLLGGCGGIHAASTSELARQGAAAGAGGVTYDGPPVELGFWNGFTGGDGPFMLDFVKAFNAEHDNITVKMNVILWVDFYQKTTAATASGNGPDVAIMQLDQLPTAAAHRIVVPLDDVASAMRLRREDFAAAVWDAGVVGGRRFGIPLDVHPLGLYYNKSVLGQVGVKAPPRDRAEYLGVLKELKGKGIKGSWVSPFFFTGSLWFQSLLPQFGGTMYDRETRHATWDSDAGVEALSFMTNLVEQGYSQRDVGQDADAIAFKNGQNAMIWNGCWAINEYAGAPGLKWGAATVPRIGPERAVWANSHQFVIMRQTSEDTNKLQAAATFIDYVSRRSLKWAQSGMVPARNAERAKPGFAKLEAQATFAEELPYVRFAPRVAGISDVRSLTLDQALNLAVLGKTPPRQALADAAQRADGLLAQNRQKYEV
jgi:multiple sugar transport system substrate-binding protein